MSSAKASSSKHTLSFCHPKHALCDGVCFSCSERPSLFRYCLNKQEQSAEEALVRFPMALSRPSWKERGFRPFTENERKGLVSFWEVLQPHALEIRERVLSRLPDNVGTPPSIIEKHGDPAVLTDRAIRHDDWDPWLSLMDDLGRFYAEGGVPYSTWFRVGEEYRNAVQQLLRQAFPKNNRALVEASLGMNRYIAIASVRLGDAYVQAKERIIKNQQEAYRALSTPILKVRDGLLVVPLMGLLDDDRMANLRKDLLDRVQRDHARALVLDLTGIAEISPSIAELLLRMIEAARFLGASAIISGISLRLSRALSDIPIDRVAYGIATDLGAGIEQANDILRLPPRIFIPPPKKAA